MIRNPHTDLRFLQRPTSTMAKTRAELCRHATKVFKGRNPQKRI